MKNTINLHLGVHVFLAAFLTLGMVTKLAYSISLVLLLLCALYILCLNRSLRFEKKDAQLIAALLIYAFLGAFIHLVGGHSLRDYDTVFRFLLVIPLFLLWRQYPIQTIFLMYCFGISGIVMGGVAWYDVYVAGLERAGLYPIRFGNIAMLTAFFCLASFLFAPTQLNTRLKVILLLGVLGGVLASILSGTRGGWLYPVLATPVLLLLSVWQSTRSPRLVWLICVLGVLGVLALYYIPQTGIAYRIALALDDLKNYQPNDIAAHTSVGARLEMWRLSWEMIQDKPWTGWGREAYREQMQWFVDNGQALKSVLHRHPHNEIFNEAVKKGVFSTLALIICLYLFPLYQFIKRLKAPALSTRYYACLGVLMILAWIVFGLTDVFLEHSQTVMYYLMYLVIFWSGMRLSEENR